MQVLITKPKKKTERSFFYCRRQAERSEVVEGYKVLQDAGSYNKTKKEDRKVFFLLPKASRAERGVEGYKVLQKAGSFNFHHLCFKWVLYHKI